MNNNEIVKYSPNDLKKTLQSTLFHFVTRSPFYGCMLSELTIKYTQQVPTAAICYNPKADGFEILLSPEYFSKHELNQRIAILYHEILHFTHQHLFRLPFISKDQNEVRLYNIAADMAINQLINDLPEGCIDVKQWKDKDGQPFPALKTMEEYYLLIRENAKEKKQKPGDEEKGQGEGEGQAPGEGSGQKQWQNVGKSNAGDNLNKFAPHDEHIWDQMTEEQKEAMLTEAKKLVNRTVQKTSFGHSIVPDSIKDLLDELEVEIKKMNCKAILRACIKKTVSCTDRENTWNRRNKRYGYFAPGTTIGKLPKLGMFIDTSGSISVTEMNEFIGIMDQFLQAGSRECELGLWHTGLYHRQKYKLRNKINPDVVQAGGTDVSCVMEYVSKKKPDLTVVLTDLYFDIPSILPKGEVIWVVSENGNMDKNFWSRLPGKVFSLGSLK